MTYNEAVELAAAYLPDKYILDRCAEIEGEYWFNYKRSDGDTIIGASLVVVNKETGEVKSKSFTEDFPRIRLSWNNAEKRNVAPKSM